MEDIDLYVMIFVLITMMFFCIMHFLINGKQVNFKFFDWFKAKNVVVQSSPTPQAKPETKPETKQEIKKDEPKKEQACPCPTPKSEVIKGMIMIWSGPADKIPTGWVLCDGTNGTPDLRDKFVLGSGGIMPKEGHVKQQNTCIDDTFGYDATPSDFMDPEIYIKNNNKLKPYKYYSLAFILKV